VSADARTSSPSSMARHHLRAPVYKFTYVRKVSVPTASNKPEKRAQKALASPLSSVLGNSANEISQALGHWG
jgi:hypothetical protein